MRSSTMRRAGLLAACLAVLASPLQAHVVQRLHYAETIVTGTEEPERTRGFHDALAIVIHKLTGNPKLLTDPRIVELLIRPHQFVQAFEYEDRMKDIPVHDEQGTRERPHFLRVTFSKSKLDATLDGLGIRQWQADRPVVGVWLGVDIPAGRFTLTDAGPDGYGQRAVITETAERIGLPILLPSPGLATPGYDDIANGKTAELQQAMPKAEALLYGLLSIRPDGYWGIAWTLQSGNTAHRWSQSRVTFDTGLKLGLTATAETLSQLPAK